MLGCRWGWGNYHDVIRTLVGGKVGFGAFLFSFTMTWKVTWTNKQLVHFTLEESKHIQYKKQCDLSLPNAKFVLRLLFRYEISRQHLSPPTRKPLFSFLTTHTTFWYFLTWPNKTKWVSNVPFYKVGRNIFEPHGLSWTQLRLWPDASFSFWPLGQQQTSAKTDQQKCLSVS